LDDQVETIESGPQRHGLLVDGLQLDRTAGTGIRKVAADGFFEGLHDAAGQVVMAENVQCSRVNSFLGQEGKWLLGTCTVTGTVGVVGDFKKSAAPVEMDLDRGPMRAGLRFQVLELDLGRFCTLAYSRGG